MPSSIKITKLNTDKTTVNADNMVSAKNNEASVVTAVKLNKDGSVRKQPGRKARVSSSKGEEIKQQLKRKVKIILPRENLIDIDSDDNDDDPKPTTDFNESEYLKERLARSESVAEELRSKLNRVADQNDYYLEQNPRYETLLAKV
jgi:hypothetical protein